MASFTSIPSCTIVAIWAMFIWNPPSPEIAHTGSSGRASRTPMAAGTAKPIAPRPPEVMCVIGRRDRLIDVHLAMHARHTEMEVMRLRERADAEQRRDDRRSGALRELPHLRVRAAHDHAAADHQQRPLRLGDEMCGLLYGVVV